MPPEDHDLLVQISTNLDHLLGRVEKQEGLVRSLDRYRWLTMGAAVAAGSYVGGMVTPALAAAVTR